MFQSNSQRSLTEVVKHVSAFDPAVDNKHPDFNYDEYVKTGDTKFIPVRDGGTATIFHLRPLGSKSWMKATAEPTRDERVYRLVQFSLIAVENWSVDGSPLTIVRKTVDGIEQVERKCLDKMYDPDLFLELGGRVAMISRIDPLRSLGSD